MNVPEVSGDSESTKSSSRFSRRKLLAGAGVSFGTTVAGGVFAAHPGLAQKQTEAGPATSNVFGGTAVPLEVTQFAGDWLVANGNLAATRSAVNSPINASNLDRLSIAWTVPVTVSGSMCGRSGMSANAVIIEQSIYYQDLLSNIFALDRMTGKELWRRNYNASNGGPNGVAVANGIVYAATGDTGIVVALDARTGEVKWERDVSDPGFARIEMAPLVYANIVYLGLRPNNVRNGTSQGILYALNAETGTTLWTFDTSIDNPWRSPRIRSGPGLWYPPSVDDMGNLYFGTGNAASFPDDGEYVNGSSGMVSNDRPASTVSIDTATGGVRWAVDAQPQGCCDRDVQQTPVLVTVTLNETPTLVSVSAGKSGTVIATLADSGALLWKTKVGRHEDDECLAAPCHDTGKLYPRDKGILGRFESPIAFAENLIFVPYVDFQMSLTPNTAASTAGGDVSQPTGGLAAIDAVTGDLVWDVKLNAMPVAGATVVNDVVLSGSRDGFLRAYELKTGKEVWKFYASAGLNAPLAIAGDMIVFSAGAPIAPTRDVSNEATPGGSTGVLPVMSVSQEPNVTFQILALKLGLGS
jgi:alcohol dehydrogenase (cytochrome c)